MGLWGWRIGRVAALCVDGLGFCVLMSGELWLLRSSLVER